MNALLSLSPAELRHAADLRESIIKSEAELHVLFGSTLDLLPPLVPVPVKPSKRRSKMSASARKKVGAAKRLWWKNHKAKKKIKTVKPSKTK